MVRILAVVLAISLTGCAAFDRTAPVPSPSPLQADDGTALAACRDAECEVEVREDDEIRLDRWAVTTMEVEYLSEEKITLSLRGSGILHVEAPYAESGSEDVTVYSYKSRSINDIVVTMVPGDSTRAILTLRPA